MCGKMKFKLMHHTVWIAALLLTLVSGEGQVYKNQKTEFVQTKKGKIRGQILESASGSLYSRFAGVPYASAPIGSSRFQLPRVHVGWNTIRDCFEFEQFCPQDTSSWKDLIHPEVYEEKMKKSHRSTAEDCLFLDIYVPRERVQPTGYSSAGLSVMVWFHPGGFENGTSMLYSLENLALAGKVIVIGVNYRLGVLGFLSLDKNIKGNLGLADQQMALHWIGENIEQFGGNKKDVTIVGSEAGGVSVSLHMLSEKSNLLFHKAISHSGSVLSYHMFDEEPSEAQEKARLLASKTNCLTNHTSAIAKCLRNLPVQNLINAAHQVRKEKGSGFLPTVDGVLITQTPKHIFRQTKYNTVPHMIGVNSHEGLRFYNKLYGGFPDLQVTEALMKYTVKNTLQSEFKNNMAKATKASEVEYGTCSQNTTTRLTSLIDFLGDYHVIAPSYKLARLNVQRRVETFFYEFVHKLTSVALSGKVPETVYSNHGDEINFVFGDVKDLLTNVTVEEHKLSDVMMKVWYDFAKEKHFVVNSKDGNEIRVPDFTEDGAYLQIDTNIQQTSIKHKFRPQRMAFWNDYLSKMRTSESCIPEVIAAPPNPAGQLRDDLASSESSVTGLAVFVVILIIIIIILVLIIVLPKIRRYRKERQPETEHDQDHHRGRHCDGCDKCTPLCVSMPCYKSQNVYSPRKEDEEAERRGMMNDTTVIPDSPISSPHNTTLDSQKPTPSNHSGSIDADADTLPIHRRNGGNVYVENEIRPPPPLPSVNNTHTTV